MIHKKEILDTGCAACRKRLTTKVAAMEAMNSAVAGASTVAGASGVVVRRKKIPNREFAAPVQAEEGPFTFVYIDPEQSDAICCKH